MAGWVILAFGIFFYVNFFGGVCLSFVTSDRQKKPTEKNYMAGDVNAWRKRLGEGPSAVWLF